MESVDVNYVPTCVNLTETALKCIFIPHLSAKSFVIEKVRIILHVTLDW